MKSYIKPLSFILGACAFAACNDISSDERYIDLPPVEAQRVVLLEEFTGQKCTNCPEAHEMIKKLEEQYGDNLIAVSIHGGGDEFSYDEDRYPYGLRNAEGQAYCDAYGIYSLPAGVVNRTTGVINRDKWAKSIKDEISRPSLLDLKAEAALNDDQSEIRIKVTASPHDNYQAHLLVWVIESGIVARQFNSSGGIISNYVHDNVFRGTVNGLEGTKVNLVTREEQDFDFTIAVKENWEPTNLSIVAFVYNNEGVAQAAKAPVVINTAQ